MRVLEKKNEENLSIKLKCLEDSEETPTNQDLKECSTLIMESKIIAAQELFLRDIAIKICKKANNLYKEVKVDLRTESDVILKQNTFYQQALKLYLFAQQMAQKMPLTSYRRAKLLAQINENIGKFKALITAREIFLEVFMRSNNKYPDNLIAATVIANWSKIVLTRTEVLPVDMSSDSKYTIKSSKNIICEFLVNYPLHECNLLKLDEREDPSTDLEAAEIVNTFIINYRDTGFFNGLQLLPSAKDSLNEQQFSLNLFRHPAA